MRDTMIRALALVVLMVGSGLFALALFCPCGWWSK